MANRRRGAADNNDLPRPPRGGVLYACNCLLLPTRICNPDCLPRAWTLVQVQKMTLRSPHCCLYLTSVCPPALQAMVTSSFPYFSSARALQHQQITHNFIFSSLSRCQDSQSQHFSQRWRDWRIFWGFVVLASRDNPLHILSKRYLLPRLSQLHLQLFHEN